MTQNQDLIIPSSRQALISEAERNALFYVPINPFVYKQPAVPMHLFEDERQALTNNPKTTRSILLDLGARMGLSYPATTPSMLARYLVVGPKDSLVVDLNAVVCIHYVMAGSGWSQSGGTRIDWKAGDVFLFPGGSKAVHEADEKGAALYLVTDEPLLSFSGTKAAELKDSKVAATYFPAEEIDLNLAKTYERESSGVEAAKSVWLINRQMESLRTTSPNITANLNTLGAGDDQRPHRHNAAALTLSIEGTGVFSLVNGQRTDWRPYGVMVTPPAALHSHHNRGENTMRSFVVQDSGLHYYTRTAGFRFDN